MREPQSSTQQYNPQPTKGASSPPPSSITLHLQRESPVLLLQREPPGLHPLMPTSPAHHQAIKPSTYRGSLLSSPSNTDLSSLLSSQDFQLPLHPVPYSAIPTSPASCTSPSPNSKALHLQRVPPDVHPPISTSCLASNISLQSST